MKNRGFTLMELLGVIIILALLMIIVFPSIINSVKNSSNKTDTLTKELIYNAADLFISEHKNDFPKMNGSKYSIELKDLVDEGFLISPIKLSDSDLDITNSKCIQVIYQGSYNYELKDTGTCKYQINYNLPSEYQQVEYIASTGTQYIDTGYIPNNDPTKELYFETVSMLTSTQSLPDKCVGGVDEGNYQIKLPNYSGSNVEVNLYYKSNTAFRRINNEKVKFIAQGKSGSQYFEYNGASLTANEVKTIKISNPIYLFGINNANNNSTPWNFIGRIYYALFKENDVPVREFIPCYRVSDNVIGMYDRVNNIFYTNLGTGTFEKGNDV